MANPNALVDSVDALSPSSRLLTVGPGEGSRLVTVAFQGGRSGLLDVASPRSAVWAQILESRRQENQPVYVEIDPATNLITELLLPRIVRVGEMVPTAAGDAVDVELIVSHARHYLRRTSPDFEQLLQTLQSAREQGTAVAVTETPDTHEIIDVRQYPTPFAMVATPEAPPAPDFGPMSAPVTQQQARDLFNLVEAQSCCPGSGAPPCIPFLYPDDGCWGRAHEMCRLMIGAGAQPNKVWNYGSLHVATRNQPTCGIGWRYHVAPTLLVSTGTAQEVQVIDPALFTGPVPQATWVGVQGDAHSTVAASDASVFYRDRGGGATYDPSYTETRRVLNDHRNLLRLRSVGRDGPPPYPQCFPRPPGVQWIGTIDAGATHRWFSWGWPAAWHMVWTIMPLTPCRGAPQLSWTVAVERASATQCTYWITVRNLTASPVSFEGRYDILSR